MSRSRYLWITEVVVAAAIALVAAAAGAGCSGGDCGPGTAAADGLELAGTGVDVRYAGLGATANNDCPDPGAPSGVVSLTINGTQTGSSFAVTLCIPRPDRLAAGDTAQLGTDVRIVDLGAILTGGCTLARATTMTPSGTVTAAGMCGNGRDAAGFALTFDGTVPMKRTCGTQVDVLVLALTGTVAVSGPGS
jgi:hypothetical protein